MMKEFLPGTEKLNHVTVRKRTLRVGARVDAIELAPGEALSPDTVWSIAIDGGFVRGREEVRPASFEILTGRLTAAGGKPRIFAYVRSEVPSIADRFAALLQTSAGTTSPKVCVITDDALEAELAELGLAFLSGYGCDGDGAWPKEESALALGIDFETAQAIAIRTGRMRFC